MNKVKQIAIFTSIRSEYGHLKFLIEGINNDPDVHYKLLVGGAHLLKEYGYTIQEILDDNIAVTETLPFLFTDNCNDSAIRSMGVLTMQIGAYLSTNKPDLLIVIGDRFELLPVVNTALVLNIPIGHISGGEVTEGAIDNQVRNAISKMAHIHFVATDEFKYNLIKMGEESWRICTCGELGLDKILKMEYISKQDLFRDLGLKKNLPIICATFHSETINNQVTAKFLTKLYREISASGQFQVVITAANFDVGGNEINEVSEDLAIKTNNLIFIKSLGKKRYFSLLKYCSLVLGNSSSGLIEAQSFNIPVINVGKRQQGRLSNPNVLHVNVNVKEIMENVYHALSDDYKLKYYDKENIYTKGDCVANILKYIKGLDTSKLLLKRTVL